MYESLEGMIQSSKLAVHFASEINLYTKSLFKILFQFPKVGVLNPYWVEASQVLADNLCGKAAHNLETGDRSFNDHLVQNLQQESVMCKEEDITQYYSTLWA
jgi:hypothetical protein